MATCLPRWVAGGRYTDWSGWTSYSFRPYRPEATLGPTYIVTPPEGYFTNTYYNYCPWSPSGRYLALTELPFQDRITRVGDIAYVVVIDLREQRIRRVYPTRSWGYQYGALVQWGADDRTLYCNDLSDNGQPVGVRIDWMSGEVFLTEGPIMDVDPVGGVAISPALEYLNATQYAYGPPAAAGREGPLALLPAGPSETEGIWRSNLTTGERELLLSTASLAAASSEGNQYGQLPHYVFSCRYSADRRRIAIVLRRAEITDDGKVTRNPSLLTYDTKTDTLYEAVPTHRWKMGAHHPSWHPDGIHLTMNMTPEWLGEDRLRFVQFRYDGSSFRILSDRFTGSGHPTLRSDGRYLLSDAYPFEPMATAGGEVPIRLIDLQAEEEYLVARVFTDLGRRYSVRRYWGPSKLDAHPVWNREHTAVCFNGAPEGGRRAVLITDLSSFFN